MKRDYLINVYRVEARRENGEQFDDALETYRISATEAEFDALAEWLNAEYERAYEQLREFEWSIAPLDAIPIQTLGELRRAIAG